MKTFKKLFIGLAAVALLVPTLAIGAAAEDVGTVPAPTDTEVIVSTYENEFYMVEDFNSSALGTYSDAALVLGAPGVSAQIAASGENNNILTLTGSSVSADNGDTSIIARPTEATDSFVIQFKLKASGSVVSLRVSGLNSDGVEVSNMILLTVDFNNSQVIAHQPGIYGTASAFICEGITPAADKWYDVSVIYNGENMTYDLTVAEEGNADNIYTATALSAILKSVSAAKLSISGTGLTDESVSFDDIYFYGGNTVCDMTNLEERTCDAIDEFVAVIDSAETTQEEKDAALAALDLIIMKRGFDSETYADVVLSGRNKLAFYYVDAYIAAVYSIGLDMNYADRVDAVEVATQSKALIPNLTGTSVDMLKLAAADAMYNRAVRNIEQSKDDSEAFITLLDGVDEKSNDYVLLLNCVEQVGELEYDATYPGVSKYTDKFTKISNKVEDIKTKAEAFIAHVNAMAAETEVFANRYDSYLKAKEYYFINSTYDGLGVAISTLNQYEPEIKAIATYCNQFLAYMENAENAASVQIRESYLEKAKVYIDAGDLNMTFAGVADAVANYDTLVASIAADIEKANVFIAEVAKLADAQTHAEIQAAIDAAKAVKPDTILGGIEGYDVAVMTLSGVESELVYTINYGKQFVELVNKIGTTESLMERHALINEAKTYVDTVDTVVEGVAGAKAMLISYIAVYEAEAQTVNDAFGATVEESAKLVSTAAPINPFLKLIAIIQKYFD